MADGDLIDRLIMYIGLVILLTFHEFGHAWTAWKCGDDTARLQGRVSLNPLDHIDPIGTVLIPLIGFLFPGAGRFLVGWARPVPVNLNNLRNPNADDLLITMAGPGMNFLLTIVLLVLARLGLLVHVPEMPRICVGFAETSMALFYFNLIPVPPLDGSRVIRIVTGMSYETYYRIASVGMLILIVLMQIPMVGRTIGVLTDNTCFAIGRWVGVFG